MFKPKRYPKCPVCKILVNLNYNFCPECGAKIKEPVPTRFVTLCSLCNALMEPFWKYCVNCGKEKED